MVFASTGFLLPPAGLLIAYRLRSGHRIECLFGFSALLGIALALFVVLPDQNQYKLHYMLAMLLAFLTLFFVRSGIAHRNATGLRVVKLYAAALVVLAILNAAYGSYAVIAQAVESYGTARFDGIHIFPSDNYGGRRPAFEWLREHTPPDAIVIAPHAYTREGLLNHGRLNYVTRRAYFYAENLSAHVQRDIELHKFYNPNTSVDQYLDLLESMRIQLPGRPLYAAVMDPELSRETMAQRGAQLVFENPPYGAHVYWLNPPTAD